MDKEQLEHWRETRRAEQLQQALKWQHIICCAMGLLIPILGYAVGLVRWGTSTSTDERGIAGRWQGLMYIGFATIGWIIWMVVWKLWGDSLLRATVPVNLLKPISLF